MPSATSLWTFSFTYSWFDFKISNDSEAFENLLLPNSPEHKFSAGLSLVKEKFNARVAGRWVDEFRWSLGPFLGDVESYGVVDVTFNYHITDNITAGVNVSNLFDNEHFEAFGGDLVGRRALFSALYRW